MSYQGHRVGVAPRVSPFQKRVYDALRLIPAGKVTTYRALADFIGCGSPRAVGQALRRNPFAPQVPCHRVINSNLTIGGFQGKSAGIEPRRKVELLRQEGVPVEKGRLEDTSRLIKEIPRQPVVRFGVITDLHSGNRPPKNGRYYRKSAAKLADCVKFMNREKPDFMIELGDLKDRCLPPDEKSTLQNLTDIEEVFCRFHGHRYHVLGNHDLDTISKEQFLANISNRGQRKALPYYSFTYHGLSFIVLDANYSSNGHPYCRGEFDWTESYLPARQLAWLAAELEAAPGPVVIFCHQRLDGVGDYFVNNAAEVRDILENSGRVRAVFQGHDHHGDSHRINGILYYTLPAAVNGPTLADNPYVLVTLDQSGNVSIRKYGWGAL